MSSKRNDTLRARAALALGSVAFLVSACFSSEDPAADDEESAEPACPEISDMVEYRVSLDRGFKEMAATIDECETLEDCAIVRYLCRFVLVNQANANSLHDLVAQANCGIQSCPDLCFDYAVSCTEGHCTAEARNPDRAEPLEEGAVNVCL